MILTVIDVETTGFSPNKDRIVEIGIVQRDERGKVLREYETLVDPERDVANTSVHGLSASDLFHAPTFDKVAETVWDFLKTSDMVCAHQFQFDWSMLSAEYERLDCRLPMVNRLCTQSLVGRVWPHLPRRLGALCYEFGIPLTAHRALADARATSALLDRCLDQHRFERLRTVRWPGANFPEACDPFPRGTSAPTAQPILSRLVDQLPSHPGEENLDEYYDLLDEVFADSILEEEEARSLLELAGRLDLSEAQVREAHEQYVAELVRVAQEDGYVSEQEQEHLENVARALEVDTAALGGLTGLNLYPRDLRGKSVCVTGEMRAVLNGRPLGRKEVRALVEEHGMIWKSGVSRKLDFLVARDVRSKSGKGKLAREYGIPIVAEQVFWNWLGVQAR
jgi:DNA polymerase-3 subunit epsilon